MARAATRIRSCFLALRGVLMFGNDIPNAGPLGQFPGQLVGQRTL